MLSRLAWLIEGKKSDEKPGVRVAADDYLSEQALWIRGWRLGLDWAKQGLGKRDGRHGGMLKACEKGSDDRLVK